MTRRIPITAVAQSGGSPGSFTVGPVTPDNTSGDWTSVFRGKYYRLKVSPFTNAEFYTSPTTPAGYDLIAATQFDVIDNPSYNGRYTVYTPVSNVDLVSSVFSAGTTLVRVNEAVGAPASPGDAANTGEIVNVSTYYIYRSGGETAVIIPPGVSVSSDGLEYPGRTFSGWGEVFNQDLTDLLQNFASATPPVDPVLGGLWFDTTTTTLKIWDGSAFVIANQAAIVAAAASYRHTQAVASASWTITHNLGSVAPFIVMSEYFVDVSGVIKPILPQDISYDDPNTITVTFSMAYSGFALIRL